MAWTTISNAAVAVGAIPSSSTVTALRDNPVAVADASSGAPVVFAGWHPHDKVSVGDGKDGLIYDFAVNGVVAEVVTPDFVDGYEYRIVGNRLSHNSGTIRTLDLDLYKETSANYQASFTSESAGNAALYNFDWEILLPRITSTAHFGRFVFQLDATLNATTVTSSYNVTPQKILKARIKFSSNSIDAGKIYMFRRREYASSP
jgi:hypothetical protein